MRALSALFFALGSVAALPTGPAEVLKSNQVNELYATRQALAIGDAFSGAYAVAVPANTIVYVSMIGNLNAAAACATVGADGAFSGYAQLSTDIAPTYWGTSTCVETGAATSRYQLGFSLTNGTGFLQDYTVFGALDNPSEVTNTNGFFAIETIAYTMNGTPTAFTLAS